MIRLQLNPNTDLVTWYFCMIPLPLLVFQRNSNQDGWDHIASVRWVPITPIAWDITILMYQLLLSLTVSASNRPDCHGKVKLEDRRDARAHPNLPNDQQQSQTQRNDTDENNDTSHQTSSKKKVNYQNTQDGEIARSNSSDNRQSVRPQPLTIEKVVNLKREGPTRWYRVKFHNKPDTAWYREGSLNIPKHLIEECLRVRTWAGKPRKRKKQK